MSVREIASEGGEVKVHHAFAISGDNVEKFGCLHRLNFLNSRMTSERNYNEVDGENEALSFGYYDDDDDFDTFTDGDGDCDCDEGG